MTVGGRIRRLRRGLRGKGRFRRELAAIEGPLATEPRLVSLFATFNQLASGERSVGPGPPPRPAWRRPWVARAVMVLALAAAAVVVVGVLLSTTMRPIMRPCLIVTTGGAPVAVATATSSPAGARLAGLRVAAARGPACPAYSSTGK